MSKLVVRSRGLGQSVELNCLQFNAPIVSSISSVQTRESQRHYPVKVNQHTADFLVQFSNEKDYENFQQFVRDNQVDALRNGRTPGVQLWWPERNINNWTGVIKGPFKAGGMRFNYSPRAQFTVDLIDSMVSTKTFVSSMAATFQTIWGWGSPDGFLSLPDLAQDILDRQRFGTTLMEAAQGIIRPPQAAWDNITNGNLGVPGDAQ